MIKHSRLVVAASLCAALLSSAWFVSERASATPTAAAETREVAAFNIDPVHSAAIFLLVSRMRNPV